MKFATLTALIGSTSAQCNADNASTECAFRGVGGCCAQLEAAVIPDGAVAADFGGFAQYIWGLPEGETLTAGHTATVCVP